MLISEKPATLARPKLNIIDVSRPYRTGARNLVCVTMIYQRH